jgi:hypothetical protein
VSELKALGQRLARLATAVGPAQRGAELDQRLGMLKLGPGLGEQRDRAAQRLDALLTIGDQAGDTVRDAEPPRSARLRRQLDAFGRQLPSLLGLAERREREGEPWAPADGLGVGPREPSQALPGRTEVLTRLGVSR